MSGLTDLRRDLRAAADPARARALARFFKTGKGGYGEGDRFVGITVPALRAMAKRHRQLSLTNIAELLASPIHEYRFVALQLLVARYRAGHEQEVIDFYLAHTRFVNNWDLVDSSAPYILGRHLLARSRRVLYRLARSSSVWERRIAIIATLPLIAEGELSDTFALAELLLGDEHDLIHKAVGWALRETGKRSPRELLAFLERHYQNLPRTSLRYAIERFPPARRRQLLAGVFPARAPRRGGGTKRAQ